MDDENQSLYHGQLLGEEGVEDDAECRDGDDKEGAMPVFKHIVRLVENEQPLNHGADQEGERGQTDLPPQYGYPTWPGQ